MVYSHVGVAVSMSDQYEFNLEPQQEKDIVEANDIIWSSTLKWCNEYDAMIVAANMLNSALRLYKTELSDDEYRMFCDTIISLVDEVQPVHTGVKH